MSVLLFHYSNEIGIVGVVLVLIGYGLLQIDKLKQDSFIFSFINFIGSIFILVSLYYHPNLASVVIEIAWLVISFFGLCKWFYLRRQKCL